MRKVGKLNKHVSYGGRVYGPGDEAELNNAIGKKGADALDEDRLTEDGAIEFGAARRAASSDDDEDGAGTEFHPAGDEQPEDEEAGNTESAVGGRKRAAKKAARKRSK